MFDRACLGFEKAPLRVLQVLRGFSGPGFGSEFADLGFGA